MKKLLTLAAVLLIIIAFPLTASAATYSGNASGSSIIYAIIVIAIITAIRILVNLSRRKYRQQKRADITQGKEPQTPTLSAFSQQNISKNPVSQNNNAAPLNLEKLKNTHPIEYKRSVVAQAAGFKDFAGMVSSDPSLDKSLAFATSMKDLNKVAIAYGYKSFNDMFNQSIKKKY